MNRIFRKISGTQKIYLFGGAIALLFIAFLLIFYVNIQKVKSVNLYSDLLEELKTEFLLIDKKKSSFTLNLKSDPSFFIKGENSYLSEHRSVNSKITSLLSEIEQRDVYEEKVLDEILFDLQSQHKLSMTYFDKYVEVLYQKGNEEHGMLGDLNVLSSQIRNKYSDVFFKNKIELLFEYQQNYLLSYNNIYLNKFNTQYREIDSLLSVYIRNNDDFPEDTIISDSQTAAEITFKEAENESDSILVFNSPKEDLSKKGGFLYLKRQLKKYNDYFFGLNEIYHGIGITEYDGIRGKMEKTSKAIEENVLLLFEVFVKIKKTHLSFVLLVMFFSLTSLFLLFIFISLLYLRYVTKSLKSIIEILSELTNGKLPPKIEVLDVGDSFNIINKKFNAVFDGMQSKILFLEDVLKNLDSSDYKLLSDDDVLGKSLLRLKENLKTTKDAESALRREENERNWINIGLTKFADILSKSTGELEEIGYNIIFNLIKYVDAVIGGVYYLNDTNPNDKYIELLAAYAYDRRKYDEKKILPGEGIIGGILKEKKTIYLKNTPERYIEVSSGLGSSTPRHLLIVPLIFEGNVLGVVEMASFTPFENYKIEFIEKVCESVANTFANQKITKNTNHLLKESENHSLKMIEKEDELYRNYLEALASKETLERDKAEWQGFERKFDEATYKLEYNSFGNIINYNVKALELFGFSELEIKEKNHIDIIPEGTMSDKEYKELWTEILSGKTVQRIVSRTINNEVYLLVENYITVHDDNNRISKIIHFAIDVSELKAIHGIK